MTRPENFRSQEPSAEFDWSTTPLGPRATWSPRLRSAVDAALREADGVDGAGNVDGVDLPATVARQAERIAAAEVAERRKDEFLAILAHELRNPLAAIALAVQVARRKLGDAADPRQLDIIERQAKVLVRIVDDLLDLTRIARGKVELQREPVDLAYALARAVDATRSIYEQRRHTLSIDTPSEPVVVDADPVRIEQILVNLLTNAAKYTEPGGKISVTLALEDGLTGPSAVVRVIDDGIGIRPELMLRLFELYEQGVTGIARAQGGLGIGLTVVRRLAEMHGGTVDAESDGPGHGSTFTVRLPIGSRGTPVPPSSRPQPPA